MKKDISLQNTTDWNGMECINQYVQELHIFMYTDGSNQLDYTVSTAIYMPKLKIKISKRISNNCSIYKQQNYQLYI